VEERGERVDGGLSPLHILGLAWSTFRDRWHRILPVAAVIAVVSSMTDLAGGYVEHMEYASRLVAIAIGLTVAMNTGASTLGSTMLTGILDRTVGEHQHGHPPRSMAWVLRTLPWMSLILADLMVTLLRLAGFLAFVLPGFAVVAFTGLVGPIIMLEGRKPVAAIRRSVGLVRPHFWLVFVLVTVPLTLESFLEDYIEELPIMHDLVAHTMALVFVEVPVSTVVALIEVTLAYQLIERDRPGSVSAAGAHD
jgi:hypothetical protein